MGRPSVRFLDEPTTGLDPQSRRAVWDEIRSLRASGVTVFLTTQHIEEADQLADRIAIVDAGAVIAEGSPRELKAAHGRTTIGFDHDGDVVEVAWAVDGMPTGRGSRVAGSSASRSPPDHAAVLGLHPPFSRAG